MPNVNLVRLQVESVHITQNHKTHSAKGPFTNVGTLSLFYEEEVFFVYYPR